MKTQVYIFVGLTATGKKTAFNQTKAEVIKKVTTRQPKLGEHVYTSDYIFDWGHSINFYPDQEYSTENSDLCCLHNLNNYKYGILKKSFMESNSKRLKIILDIHTALQFRNILNPKDYAVHIVKLPDLTLKERYMRYINREIGDDITKIEQVHQSYIQRMTDDMKQLQTYISLLNIDHKITALDEVMKGKPSCVKWTGQ